MSSVNSTYSSSSRLTGMYSDLDTDAIVKSMCSNQQAKIDKQDRTKTTYEWYNESVSDVVDAVKEFSNTYCSVLGSSSMLKSATYSSFKVTSDSTGNAASLTALSSADAGNYAIKVSQLAKNATASSSGRISANGTEISSSNTTTLGKLSFANKLTFGSDGKLSFAINGKTFSFSSDTTLQSMLNTINTDTHANVTMKYSRLSDSFTIAADSGGKKSKVNIENYSGNAFGAGGAFMIDIGEVKNGKDSIAEINGTSVVRDSNEYTVDGINYVLNKVTAGTSEEYINFTIERDYSSTLDAVSAFVDAFNTLTAKLSTLTTSKDYSSKYEPLTDAQKEEMTEAQIKTWESKAKNGLLRHDSKLENLIAGLKDAFFSSAGGTGKSAASIGISSGSYFTADKGKLILDTDTLSAALKTNPEEVISIFTNGSSSVASVEQGLIYKVKNALTSYSMSAANAISSNEDKIDSIDKVVDTLGDRLDALAEKYYQKFSAMETALATLNSQASYISQLFS